MCQSTVFLDFQEDTYYLKKAFQPRNLYEASTSKSTYYQQKRPKTFYRCCWTVNLRQVFKSEKHMLRFVAIK